MKNILMIVKNLFFLLTFNSVLAQIDLNQSSYTLSSPEVYNLEKFYLDNTSNYTGKVNIEIPIYTIKTGGIEYPIKLVYNSGGIKVDQLASEVGLGWSLTSSMITRTINKVVDFNPEVGFFNTQDGQQNWSTSNSNLSGDAFPDIYHFYGNGQKSDFFFSDKHTAKELNPSGNKIEGISEARIIDTKRLFYKISDPNCRGESVVIRQPEPTTYDFGSIIFTTAEGIKYTFSDNDYGLNSIDKKTASQVSAWHITEIQDLKTGNKINFIYEENNLTNTIYNTVIDTPYGSLPQHTFYQHATQRFYGYSILPYNPEYESEFGCSYKFDIKKKRLVKIIFDQGEIQFNYNNNNTANPILIRDDVYNADCLTQIYLKDKNSNTIKAYEFSYDYFISPSNVGDFNPDLNLGSNYFSTYRYKRLKLTKFGETEKPKYKFNYDQSINLPPVNSFSIDFLGYYNNSVDMPNTQVLPYNVKPTLYYYPNNFEKSILPYPIPGISPIVIPGHFNRQANDYAKAWSLTKIELPTGGTKEYVYESNSFEEFGQEIKGGGIRIVQQNLNDDFGNIRTINYSYKKQNGNTSGKLSSTPYFGFPNVTTSDIVVNYPADEISPPSVTNPPTNVNMSDIQWVLFEKGNLNADLNTGSFVGYSRVVETELGAGKKEYLYTSNEDSGFSNLMFRFSPSTSHFHPDFLYEGWQDPETGQMIPVNWLIDYGRINFIIANSGINSNIFTDNSYKRGKLLSELIYDNSNRLLSKTNFTYSENLLNTYTYYNDEYEYPIPISRVPEILLETFPCSPPPPYSCSTRYCAIAFSTERKDIKVSQFLPSSKTVISYDSNNNPNNFTTTFYYNSNADIRNIQTVINGGDTKSSNYYYAQDSQMANEPSIADMIAKNVIGIPLDIQTYHNSEKTTEEKTVYVKDASTNNLLLPKYVYAKKGTDANSVIENKVTYDLYDEKGNLLQYTQTNGIPVSLIWGYNKTLLLAKIENASYTSITPSLIAAAQSASDTGTETNLLSSLNAIRNVSSLSNTMITTYTHKPLIGVSTITDFKGYTIYYNYDVLGRLINIKDTQGNLIKENQYNYKP